MNVRKDFEDWVKLPKIQIKEKPKEGDLIIQIYLTKKYTGVIASGSLVGGIRKYTLQPYPYAVVLKSGAEGYKEGDIIYLSDNILLTKDNPEWLSWKEKIENQKPTPHDPEPRRMIGGLNELEPFRFKKNKFKVESEDIDEELYQIPSRLVKGIYEN